MDFGRVLGGGWEAKILDFHIFFDILSKHFFNNFWKGPKIEKMSPTRPKLHHVGHGLRNERPLGERKREGGQCLV